MAADRKAGAVVIGSGNIGTDLHVQDRAAFEAALRWRPWSASTRTPTVWRGPAGAVSRRPRTASTGWPRYPSSATSAVLFDATSAGAHERRCRVRAPARQAHDRPDARGAGPLRRADGQSGRVHLADNVNMVTCGGQATIPIVAAVGRVAPVAYAEIVASIASRSAGPGTRANIDEFTETTAPRDRVGRRGRARQGDHHPQPRGSAAHHAGHGLLPGGGAAGVTRSTRRRSRESVEDMVARVQEYVPGYRLKQARPVRPGRRASTCPRWAARSPGTKVSVFLEVSGAGHYLPEYAGNLDIMTSAALRTAERIAGTRPRGGRADDRRSTSRT